MARTRAATFDAQREAILRAAAVLFAEQGFAGASMAQLAERCGVSKALLYHYYRAKEDILFDLIDRHAQRLVEIAREVVRAAAPGEDMLATLIRGFLREYQHAQGQHRVLVQDMKFLPAPQRQVVVRRQREIVQAFSDAILRAYPQMRASELARPLTMLLFGMINWHFTWLKPTGKLTYADFADLVIAMFHGGLAALGRSSAPASVPDSKDRHAASGTAHG